MLSQTRDLEAAKQFFARALVVVGKLPQRVTTDGHAAYPRAIRETLGKKVLHRCNPYLNSRLEIVFTQMTKPDLLATRMSRKHVADFDFTVGDQHAINQ
jgi:transposase-like protein